MTIKLFGDGAILIDFEQKIEEEINATVIALQKTIETEALPGVTFCIPAYCSLTVGYDRTVTRFDVLKDKIKKLAASRAGKKSGFNKRTLNIPVCYEGKFALDFADLAKQTGLTRAEIIALHTSTPFRVYMLGFLPGFAYLGRLPEQLFCTRKTTPRLRVPARSVGLAGFQTGIYPSEVPGGWQIVGQTPVQVFDGEKENPFLFQAGDEVNFYAISNTSFQNIEKDIQAGTFTLESMQKK